MNIRVSGFDFQLIKTFNIIKLFILDFYNDSISVILSDSYENIMKQQLCDSRGGVSYLLLATSCFVYWGGFLIHYRSTRILSAHGQLFCTQVCILLL